MHAQGSWSPRHCAVSADITWLLIGHGLSEAGHAYRNGFPFIETGLRVGLLQEFHGSDRRTTTTRLKSAGSSGSDFNIVLWLSCSDYLGRTRTNTSCIIVLLYRYSALILRPYPQFH
jgi:hypothetical protein